MSSAIMYKFRASTNFESLPMPGTSARLFDVKRAIVRAKKLDKSSGQLEFDFSVKNAMTHEAYDDESMLLPRGSRLIVQRLPASRGHGLLSKIARADAGISSVGVHVAYGNTAAAQSGFYTIESHKGEQDEFVDARPAVLETPDKNIDEGGDDSEKELAALKAVTDIVQATHGSSTAFSRSAQPGKFRSNTGVGGVPLPTMAVPNFKQHNNFHSRPNADPELRDQEQRLSQAPKKNRATGIPRTFLNITKQSTVDADGIAEGEDGDDNAVDNSMVRLQPNDRGFKALVNRGGGLSGSGVGGKRHDLDYALKITARDIPDHLQCGICNQVVKNAMLISWDTEGRTACEFCMRDGLANNGYRCPLTGNEGVSPDDLFPNIGLRKAAELFKQDVIRCMLEIVEQQEANEEEERKTSTQYRGTEFEGDSVDRGMIMKKKAIVQEKKRRHSDDFAVDDFGGDVFDVSNDVVASTNKNDDKAIATKPPQNENKNEILVNNSNKSIAESADDSRNSALNSGHIDSEKDIVMTNDQSKNVVHSSPFLSKTLNTHPIEKPVHPGNNLIDNQKEASKKKQIPPPTIANRKEMSRKRGVPAGYMMGPAGGLPPKKLSVSSHADTVSTCSMGGGRRRGGQGNYNHHHGGRGEEMQFNTFDNQDGGFHGRGRGRGGGRFHQGQKPTHVQQSVGGDGRGNRGGFGQTNYQNRGGKTAQQGWRGDYNGRGNPSGGNGDYLINQDGQQLGGNNPNNHFGQNGHFSQNGKRPRSGSGDRHSSSGRHEHTNHGPPDEQVRQFRNNNNRQQNVGRGRGFDQRANGFDQRGRGDFNCGGSGRGDSYSQGRRGRGEFSRGRGGHRRGRF